MQFLVYFYMFRRKCVCQLRVILSLCMIACNYKYQQNVAAVEKLRNLWLPPWLSRIVTSSRFLRGLRWVDSTVSELSICPIFLDSLTLEDETDR